MSPLPRIEVVGQSMKAGIEQVVVEFHSLTDYHRRVKRLGLDQR